VGEQPLMPAKSESEIGKERYWNKREVIGWDRFVLKYQFSTNISSEDNVMIIWCNMS
jgi:hypothetical protein